MFSFLKRKAKEKIRDAQLGEWGIYLGDHTINFKEGGGIEGLKSVPYQVKISPVDAEKMLAQDPRAQYVLNFGRWQGDKFEAGQRFAFENSHDVVFQSPDGLHGVRLKCGPLSMLGGTPLPLPNLKPVI